MSQSYTASDIEVLSGLEPVRRRPGMYTHTQRPNHLAHEVIDNSVDEAIAGYCKQIDVVLYKDGSLEVADDGRGMPVDVHPKEKVSGAELILTRLHAGGKFSDKTYKFSGGLHGVGVSVVNALSKHLECWIKRGGKEYNISFKDGKIASKLEEIGTVGQRNTGTTLRFWPDPKFFDSDKFSVPQLKHTLKAKAVLCPGLRVTFKNEASGEKDEWFYTGDLGAYLVEELEKHERIPAEPITGTRAGDDDAVDYALCWAPDAEKPVGESYVNLIPTPEGGTHVNGLRAGVAQAVREFCEFRNLVPRGIKLTPEDVWDKASYVLSVKIHEPQFAGQMKERLGSRDAARRRLRARFRGAVAQPSSGCRRAYRAVRHRQRPGAREGRAARGEKAHCRRPRAARQACRLRQPGAQALRAVPGRRRFGRRFRQAGARQGLPGDHAAARQDPEHLGGRPRAAGGERRGAQHQRRPRRRSGLDRSVVAALSQGLHPRRCRFRRAAHRDAFVRAVPAALPAAGGARPRARGDAAAVSDRCGQTGALRARRRRA